MELLNVASPLYWAVMVWVPPLRLLVTNVAAPLLRGMFPEMARLPSKKTIVPVAEAGASVAVKLNEFPKTEGFVPALKARATTGVGFGEFTICCNGAERPALKVASPLYCAVIACAPMGRVEVVKLAEPATRATASEMGVDPSKNVTVPVAELGLTVAVKLSESPRTAGFEPAAKLTFTLVLPLDTVSASAVLTEPLRWLSPV